MPFFNKHPWAFFAFKNNQKELGQMKDTPKMISYNDLKEMIMNKRNAVNDRFKLMRRGIQTMMTGEFEL